MSTFIDENLTVALLLAAAPAALALLFAGYLTVVLRRYRRDQKVVMGGGLERDLVAHARAVQQNVDGLSNEIRRLTGELQQAEKRLDECFTHRSVMRYDAYNDLSGMQSTSVALLDAQFSGIILSSIQSRDHARIYVKEVRNGDSREKLSPEEIDVLKEAMGLKAVRASKLSMGGANG